MELIDTHCHIHAAGKKGGEEVTRLRWRKAGKSDPDEMIRDALKASVTGFVCVGTDAADSRLAIEFVSERDNCWATVGIHPHEASKYIGHKEALDSFALLVSEPKVVAIGECGLDYFYTHSPKEAQIDILKFQLGIAQKHNLPMVFHVREAYDDFWPIVDQYKGIRGVIHSFSATGKELVQIMERDLYVGLNGIMTFTKETEQLEAAKALPLQKLLLETDAPFLTPNPFRGTICQPKHVRVTAEFLSELRGESLESLAAASTQNARDLFNI